VRVYRPPANDPCVSSSRTAPELAVHAAESPNTRDGTRAPLAICSLAYSYLALRATSECRSLSAPNSWSTLARARGPVPNPANVSRQLVRASSSGKTNAARRAHSAPPMGRGRGSVRSVGRFEGLKRHPTRAILHGFLRMVSQSADVQSLPLGVTGNTPDSGSGESWFDPRRGNCEGPHR
jgi:hypothetical protein